MFPLIGDFSCELLATGCELQGMDGEGCDVYLSFCRVHRHHDQMIRMDQAVVLPYSLKTIDQPRERERRIDNGA
jgi:hypothetical protein